MTGAERAALRARIDAELRARMAIPVCPGGWASEYGYKRQGCRCEACFESMRVKWRRYRARRRGREAARTSAGASA